VLFALGFASRQGLVPAMVATLLRGRSMGALMGIQTAGLTVGSALGPWLGGWVFDSTGSYYAALAIALLCSVAALICIWLAAPRRGRARRGGRLVGGRLPGY
jgi:predicted MFS family arabinose efflux permease